LYPRFAYGFRAALPPFVAPKADIKRIILKHAFWLSDLKLEVDAINPNNGSLQRGHAVCRVTAVPIALRDYGTTG
jgi:hypothetical protein